VGSRAPLERRRGYSAVTGRAGGGLAARTSSRSEVGRADQVDTGKAIESSHALSRVAERNRKGPALPTRCANRSAQWPYWRGEEIGVRTTASRTSEEASQKRRQQE
jgi:hypothetical protein